MLARNRASVLISCPKTLHHYGHSLLRHGRADFDLTHRTHSWRHSCKSSGTASALQVRLAEAGRLKKTGSWWLLIRHLSKLAAEKRPSALFLTGLCLPSSQVLRYLPTSLAAARGAVRFNGGCHLAGREPSNRRHRSNERSTSSPSWSSRWLCLCIRWSHGSFDDAAPGWNSSIHGPCFVTGTIYSGAAAFIASMRALRKLCRLEFYVTAIHFRKSDCRC